MTIVCSIILLAVLSALLPKPSNLKLDREVFWISKTFDSEKYAIVIGGDSRIYRGVSPEDVLTPFTEDLNAINLGYSSGGFDKTYRSFLLSKLDRESNIQALILGLTPHSLTPNALENKHFHEIASTPKVDQFKTLYLSALNRLFEPSQFKSLFDISKKSNSNSIELLHKNGWAESDNLIPDSLKALKSYSKVFDKNTVQPNAIHDLMDWVDSLTQLNIKVIGFRPPTTLRIRMLEDSISGYEESTIIQEFQEHGGHWINVNDRDYKTYDGSHLRAFEARKFSKEIGEIIKSL